MSRFTARAHGYGLVDWSRADVDAYAMRLLQTHVRGRRWLPHRASSCRECGGRWPCPAAAWAGQWSDGAVEIDSRSHS